MGYIILSKPSIAGHEGITSRCQNHFDSLFFRLFGLKYVAAIYDRNCHRSGCRLFDGSHTDRHTDTFVENYSIHSKL